MVGKENLKDIYPLSPMQEGMFFQALYEKGSTAYFEQISYRVAGSLDPAAFEESWNELFRRHDALRSVFLQQKGKRPLQVVLKERRVDFGFEDLREMSSRASDASSRGDERRLAGDPEEFIRRFKEEDRRRGFNLAADALVRIRIFRLGDATFEVVWSWHHILMDGWSVGIVQSEFMEIYESIRRGVKPSLPPVAPYSRYVRLLQSRDREASLEYWREYLSGYEQVAVVPGKVRPGASAPGESSSGRGASYELRKHVFELGEDVSRGLRDAASSLQVTVNALFQSAWAILLGAYNRTDDVVFGAVVSGRPPDLPDVDRMVGLLINTVPVRVRMDGRMSVRELATAVNMRAADSEAHHHCLLSDVQNRSALKQGLFDHIVAFENYPVMDSLRGGGPNGPSGDGASNGAGEPDGSGGSGGAAGFIIDRVESFEQTGYDFVVVIVPGGPSIRVELHYNGAVYEDERVERVGGHFRQALSSVLRDASLPVGKVEVLTEAERERVLVDFNRTETPYPSDRTLVDLFEEQAERTPGLPAVVHEGVVVSYADLKGRADAIARELLEGCGARPQDRVGVVLDRSEWLPAAFLGVMKAGCAYMPVDPAYPEERIRFMVEDSGCRAVLSEPRYMGMLASALAVPVMNVAAMGKGRTDAPNSDDPDRRIGPDDAAYLIYTSGSTGRPKGVVVEHRSAVNLATWHRHWYEVTEHSRATLYASPAFDASIWEMVPYLLSGSCLYPVGEHVRTDMEALIEFYLEHSITHSFAPPAVCEALCRESRGRLDGGRITILTGGDTLKDIGEGTVRAANNYGPTEYTVVTTSIFLSRHEVNSTIPIGRPIDNTEVLILDHHRRPVPVGLAGEMFIGGAGLARGYWNRPELTAERFVPHPFRRGATVYRTGDLGRWREDGVIEFLGRNDDQVKIRGFRIELGEVEAALAAHPGVSQAAVLAREGPGGDKKLVAYVAVRGVGDGADGEDGPASPEDLALFLGSSLPDYMVPSVFVTLDSLPLTSSGKVDRRALPEPDAGAARGAARNYAAPRNPTETALAGIWAEILGVDRVGIRDNFFEVGGHSLMATAVMSRIRTEFKVELMVRAIFEGPTVAALSRVVEEAAARGGAKTAAPAITRVSRASRRTGTAPGPGSPGIPGAGR